MDFHLSQVAVPFRMQPGLRRVDSHALRLTPLDPASILFADKHAVVVAGQSRLAMPGFDAAPALAAIAARGTGAAVHELAYEEDFAVLDGRDGTLPWLSVCVPSHWAPEDKLGLAFAEVHRPVADSATLVAAAAHLVAVATGGDCWERFVWTISPSARYDQHPRRHVREPWPEGLDDDAFAARCWLRAERQCFFPVGQGTQQAVFTIRVMLQPLLQAVASADDARRLHDSLESMTPQVLDYKGIARAREPLLRWLGQRS